MEPVLTLQRSTIFGLVSAKKLTVTTSHIVRRKTNGVGEENIVHVWSV